MTLGYCGINKKTDLPKIKSSSYMDKNTPAILLRNVSFYISLQWCQQGREFEGQLELIPEVVSTST